VKVSYKIIHQETIPWECGTKSRLSVEAAAKDGICQIILLNFQAVLD